MNDLLPRRMEELGIDTTRSLHILDRLNAGAYDGIRPVVPRGIPVVDGELVLDRTVPSSLTIPDDLYQRRIGEIAPEIGAERFGTPVPGDAGPARTLREEELRVIGILLYPYLAYGVLNGGSATSYADRKKNESLDPALMELYREDFERLAPTVSGRPKGVTPAWVNPDGTPGASFLELKFRMLLLKGEEYRRIARQYGITAPAGLAPLLPFFEMTSNATEDLLRSAYGEYRESPLLRSFPEAEQALETLHAVQPLLAALTHSEEGRPRRIFSEAWGRENEPLGLPGGHGQNFQVLAPIYRRLLELGKRFIYLGNVDNLGFTVDPVSLAIVALRGAPAGFDFAFRTPLDVKGGVLVYDQENNLNCADIGAAISREDVLAAEKRGEKILFNCATGLFDLRRLCDSLEEIVQELPMRISDQQKDAGRYSQAEQVTWEVIAMLDRPLVFGIDKYRRFLAAKMLLETLLTSGLRREEAAAIQPTVEQLSSGLTSVLEGEYGMVLEGSRWRPQSRS
ncbi:MAG: hypothetical protein EA427_09185 [Spirochaetaceae bacterium]|nr:MAG: hypothetical protein EA427_09185 [Spirochaetaceae bacterium]